MPFCATRCGYCDFNTYTADEPGGAGRDSYADLAIAEIRQARRVAGDAAPQVQTVFFGGGTPTLLAPPRLAAILRAIDGEFGLAPGAEVTTEANPESVDERSLAGLRQAGFTRISFGMQSAVPHVLATLDRVHTPERAVRCAAWARAAGFGQVSLDLIYGTPGESDADWRRSLDAAVAAGPDHISAYSLIVEDGTRLAAQIRRGKMAAPDDDAMADKYLAADEVLAAAGLRWYENLELGGRRGRAVPAQPAVLDRRGLVGDRARGAQPYRRYPVVECPASAQLRRQAGGGGQSRAGPRGARRCRAADRADHAGDQAGGRLPGQPADRPRAGRRAGSGRGRPGRARRLGVRTGGSHAGLPAARGCGHPRPDRVTAAT